MTSVMHNGLVEFRFYRPDAQDVKVVGSFNAWGLQQPLAMKRDERHEGWWTAAAPIEPGEHTFRYKVIRHGTMHDGLNGDPGDAEWFTDYASNGVERNKHGWNSILIVPERKSRITAADDAIEAVAA